MSGESIHFEVNTDVWNRVMEKNLDSPLYNLCGSDPVLSGIIPGSAGIILGMGSATERWCYNITLSFIG